MTRVVRHELSGVDMVRATLEKTYRTHAERLAAYGPKLAWSDARTATVTVTVMAKTVRTTFTIDEQDVHVDSTFPFALSFFEGQFLSKVCARLEQAFAEARTAAG
jgi:hypothetical protein